MTELELNRETICFVITKAKEFHAKEEVFIPEEPNNSSDDWALQVLADHAEDLTYQELKLAINELDKE